LTLAPVDVAPLFVVSKTIPAPRVVVPVVLNAIGLPAVVMLLESATVPDVELNVKAPSGLPDEPIVPTVIPPVVVVKVTVS
jgi:hypothetical protein